MSDNPLIPISDEQAKLGQEIVGALRDTGGYLADLLGDLPKELIGLLGGDSIRVRRAERLTKLWHNSKKRLEQQGIKEPEPAPLKLALPILAAAADETYEELIEIWTRLFAACMHPDKSKLVRRGFIEAVKKLDPLDAPVLEWVHQHSGSADHAQRNTAANDLRVNRDEVDVSIQNLVKAEFLGTPGGNVVALTSFGREFLRCIGD
jgi:Abortive infection alpha